VSTANSQWDQQPHCETTPGSAAAWKSLWVSQAVIPYPISQRAGSWVTWLGGRRRSLCYPLPLITQSVAMGQRLNCQPVTYIPALPRLTRGRVPGLSVCLLMSSIRISLVVVLAGYCRRSLLYDIAAMCGWRSILQYRLIEIIPI